MVTCKREAMKRHVLNGVARALAIVVPLTALTSLYAFGQFWEPSPTVLGDDVEDLIVLASGRVVAAVDDEGLFISDDSGESFSKVLDESFLFELAETDGKVFAVGLRGVFTSTDDATTWTQLLPADAWSIMAIGTTVVIGGSASILFASFDGGDKWLVPNAAQLPFFESTAVLVVAGTGSLIAYKTIFSDLQVSTDSGENWSNITAIDPDVIEYIDGVFYADRFDEIWSSTDLLQWSQFGTDTDIFWEDIEMTADAIAVAGPFRTVC